MRLATVLGTFQATLTDFPYLRDIWRSNTAEERLLGVSLTGALGGCAAWVGRPERMCVWVPVCVSVCAHMCVWWGGAIAAAALCRVLSLTTASNRPGVQHVGR